MKPTIYVETTIISYLTAWPSRDATLLARQELTRRWWAEHRSGFDLFASDVVIVEASAGDTTAAVMRLEALADIRLLSVNESTARLASQLATALALPSKALRDAAHLAISAVHGIEILLTWNCTHLANDDLTHKIDQTCAEAGFVAPRILTPELLMETQT